MHITLVSIGKTKSAPCATLEDEYAKRIAGRFDFERKYLRNEKEMVEHLAGTKASVILLDEHGSVSTSHEFAQQLERYATQTNDLVFVIGDAAGFPPEVRALDTDMMALSEMTFPHEIARVLFIEQLYRAQTILEGHPYHK